MTDHIDAIAIAIESLGFNIGHAYERRAKARFVEHALRLAGYKIARDDVFATALSTSKCGDDRG